MKGCNNGTGIVIRHRGYCWGWVKVYKKYSANHRIGK